MLDTGKVYFVWTCRYYVSWQGNIDYQPALKKMGMKERRGGGRCYLLFIMVKMGFLIIYSIDFLRISNEIRH